MREISSKINKHSSEKPADENSVLHETSAGFDSRLSDTVEHVKTILHELSLDVSESCVHHSVSDTYTATLKIYERYSTSDLNANDSVLNESKTDSIRISDEYAATEQQPVMEANGKGMSEQRALASAYGELMERLECGALLADYKHIAYRNGDLSYRWSPDEKEIDADLWVRMHGDIIRSLFDFSDDAYQQFCQYVSGQKLLCIPFTELSHPQCINHQNGNISEHSHPELKKETVYLPYPAIFEFIGSNGMSAGNCDEDAIAHGICELYERDALMRIYRDNEDIPKLHKNFPKDCAAGKRIRRLEERGFAVDILDCSMGRNYPVAGIKAVSEDGLYLSLGANADPMKALESCVTEMFQITDESVGRKKASKSSCGTRKGCRGALAREYYHHQLVRSRHLGSGDKPDNVYNIKDVCTEDFKWDIQGRGLDYLVSLTERLGYHLFVRNCNCLGFPACIVFIPEIALGDYMEEDGAEDIAEDIAAVFLDEIEIDMPQDYGSMLSLIKRAEAAAER